jgi:hypothetical protein
VIRVASLWLAYFLSLLLCVVSVCYVLSGAAGISCGLVCLGMAIPPVVMGLWRCASLVLLCMCRRGVAVAATALRVLMALLDYLCGACGGGWAAPLLVVASLVGTRALDSIFWYLVYVNGAAWSLWCGATGLVGSVCFVPGVLLHWAWPRVPGTRSIGAGLGTLLVPTVVLCCGGYFAGLGLCWCLRLFRAAVCAAVGVLTPSLGLAPGSWSRLASGWRMTNPRWLLQACVLSGSGNRHWILYFVMWQNVSVPCLMAGTFA